MRPGFRLRVRGYGLLGGVGGIRRTGVSVGRVRAGRKSRSLTKGQKTGCEINRIKLTKKTEWCEHLTHPLAVWDRVRGLRGAGRGPVLTVVRRLPRWDLIAAVKRIGRVEDVRRVLTRVIHSVRIGRHRLDGRGRTELNLGIRTCNLMLIIYHRNH